jgi:hypothetical protein
MQQNRETPTAYPQVTVVDMGLESLKLRESILDLTNPSSLVTETLNQLPSWFEQLPLYSHASLLTLQKQLVDRILLSSFVPTLTPQKEKKANRLMKTLTSKRSNPGKTERHPALVAILLTLSELQLMLRGANAESYKSILAQLEQLFSYYDSSGQEGNEKMDGLQHLRIQNPCLGYRDLSDAAAKRFAVYFLSQNERGKQPNYRANQYGLHAVIQMNQTHYKISPTAPGIEYAVHALGQLFTGQVSAPTELLVVEKSSLDEEGSVEVKFLPVLASRTIPGILFRDLLEQQPLAVKKIDSYNFSLQFILALLAPPGDGKTDNFIVKAEYDIQGQIDRYTLVSVDSDEAFVDPIFASGSSVRNHSLAMKTCLFCLPQMDEVVDSSLFKQLMEQDPIVFVLNWLKLLAQYNEPFEARGVATHHLKDILSKVALPLRFVPKTALNVYQTFCQIRSALRKDPQLTHKGLLKACYPLVAFYYDYVRKEANGDWMKAMDLVYRGPFFAELQLNQSQKDGLNVIVQNGNAYKDLRQQTVIQAVQEFCEALNFSSMDVEVQQAILLQVATDFPSLPRLVLNHCGALGGSLFQEMAKYFTHLDHLVLDDCETFNAQGMHTLLQRFPNLQVTIHGLKAFKPHELLTFFRFCSRLHIILQDGSQHLVDRKNVLLLPAALKQKDLQLVTFLLLAGFHLTGDIEKYFPLFEAIEQKQAVLVKELIHYGSDVNQYFKDTSPLDRAYQLFQLTPDTAIQAELQQVIAHLLEAGAIESRSPGPILTIGQMVWAKQTDNHLLADKLIHFALAHNLLSASLVDRLVNPKMLEVDWSSKIPVGYQLTNDVLKALLSRKTAVRVLNLSGCKGVTKDHLLKCIEFVYETVILDFQQALEIEVVNSQSELSIKFKQSNIQIQIDAIQVNGAKAVQAQFEQVIGVLSQSANQVKKLEITNSALSYKQIEQLADAVNHQISLQRVRLSGLGFGKQAASAVVGFFRLMNHLKSSQLTQLFLDSNDLSFEHAVFLSHRLPDYPNLKEFSLYRNPLRDKGLLALADSLRNCRQLTMLNLNEIGLEDQGFIDWIQAGVPPRLMFLDIGYNKLTRESVASVNELVRLNESVSELRYEGQSALEEAMPKNINELLQKNTRFEKQRQVLQSYQTTSQKLPVVKPVKPPRQSAVSSTDVGSILATLPQIGMSESFVPIFSSSSSSSSLSLSTLLNPFSEVSVVSPSPASLTFSTDQ